MGCSVIKLLLSAGKDKIQKQKHSIIGYASFTVYKSFDVSVHSKLNVKWWNIVQLWLSKTTLIATNHITAETRF